jgi:hypothetical protein
LEITMGDEAPTTPPPAPQKPSVGRVVHYVLPAESPHAGEHRAAVIARIIGGDPGPDNVPEQIIHLSVHKGSPDDFTGCTHAIGHVESSAVALVSNVPHDSAGAPDTWHWPERA